MNSCAIQRDISESKEGVEVKRADRTTTSPVSLEEIVQFLREKWLEPEYARSVK